MAYKFLVTREIPQAGMDLLRAAGEVVVNQQDRTLTSTELLEMGKNCDGWLTMLTDAIRAKAISAGASVSTSGVLDTPTCTCVHVDISMLLYPTA